jgi:hypothetical protein
MNIRFVVTACSAAVLGLAISFSVPAAAQDAKACGKQWTDMTKDQKKGLKKKDYVKDCVAKAPATEPKKETKKETKKEAKEKAAATTAGPAGKPGRQAMIERERACGKEWRENKAAGKIEKGQTWPKYWSACNTRMKAQGM